jgi:hypothetical protein
MEKNYQQKLYRSSNDHDGLQKIYQLYNQPSHNVGKHCKRERR